MEYCENCGGNEFYINNDGEETCLDCGAVADVFFDYYDENE